MKLYLGADHGGFELKQDLIEWLEQQGHQVEDCGAYELQPADDYPQYAWEVATKVVADPDSLGVLACRFGGGMTIAANKAPGARAVMAQSVPAATKAREDNDANILVISGDLTPTPAAKELLQAFLATPFSTEARHQRRLHQIADLEKKV